MASFESLQATDRPVLEQPLAQEGSLVNAIC